MRRALGLFVLLVSIALPSGCASLSDVSSGQIGCPPGEIVVSDHTSKWGTSTWTATCRDRRFFCTHVSGGGEGGGQTSCKPEEAAPGGPPTPVAGGCQYDQHCKGDRICEQGQCVQPAPTGAVDTPPAAAPVAPAPAPAAANPTS